MKGRKEKMRCNKRPEKRFLIDIKDQRVLLRGCVVLSMLLNKSPTAHVTALQTCPHRFRGGAL